MTPDARSPSPSRVDSKTITTTGTELTYATAGDPDGTTILVHHGAPGSRHVLALLDDTARSVGVRLLAPDRPGYGDSPPRSDWTVTDWPEQATAVLDAESAPTAGLLAFSGGTRSALALAASRPERVDRVALCSPAGPPGAPRAGPARLLGLLARRFPILLRPLLAVQRRVILRSDADDVTGLVTDADLSPATTEAVARTIRESVESGTDGLRRETVRSVEPWPFDPDDSDAPITIYRGRHDENVPTEAVAELCERLPTARKRVFDDRDHLTALLREQRTVLGWLDE